MMDSEKDVNQDKDHWFIQHCQDYYPVYSLILMVASIVVSAVLVLVG